MSLTHFCKVPTYENATKYLRLPRTQQFDRADPQSTGKHVCFHPFLQNAYNTWDKGCHMHAWDADKICALDAEASWCVLETSNQTFLHKQGSAKTVVSTSKGPKDESEIAAVFCRLDILISSCLQLSWVMQLCLWMCAIWAGAAMHASFFFEIIISCSLCLILHLKVITNFQNCKKRDCYFCTTYTRAFH